MTTNTRLPLPFVLATVAMATLALTATSANAQLLLTFTEEGSDVRLTYSGSIDLTNANFTGDAGINRAGVGNEVGQTRIELNSTGLTGVVGGEFYSGSDLLGVDLANATYSGTPDAGNTPEVFILDQTFFGVAQDGVNPINNNDVNDLGIYAPSGFITFAGESFASMGLDLHTPDQLINLWGTSANAPDSELVQFTVASAATVPEPASVAIWSMIGIGLAGFGVYRARCKNQLG